MNEWIKTYESIWLFWVLGAELLVSSATLCILIAEYFYDAKLEEEKKQKRKVSKKKVRIVIDKEGNSRIAEAPAGIDITIDQEGQ